MNRCFLFAKIYDEGYHIYISTYLNVQNLLMLSQEELKGIKQKVNSLDERYLVVFNALSDGTRYKIFSILLNHDDVCVSEFAKILGVSVPAASQQLSVLEKAGLVERYRMGQMTCYRVKQEVPEIDAVIPLIQSVFSGRAPQKGLLKMLFS